MEYRYKVLVMLRQASRPKSYDFHCFRCNMKVVEISGADVIAFDDAADIYTKVTTGVKCKGRLANNEGRCPFMFFFEEVKK